MKEKSMSVSEAVRHFAELVNRANYLHESTLLLKNNIPVAKIVPATPDHCLAEELAESWKEMPHLSPEDAGKFEIELDQSKSSLIPPDTKWE